MFVIYFTFLDFRSLEDLIQEEKSFLLEKTQNPCCSAPAEKFFPRLPTTSSSENRTPENRKTYVFFYKQVSKK